jgi:hypothetical protein
MISSKKMVHHVFRDAWLGAGVTATYGTSLARLAARAEVGTALCRSKVRMSYLGKVEMSY